MKWVDKTKKRAHVSKKREGKTKKREPISKKRPHVSLKWVGETKKREDVSLKWAGVLKKRAQNSISRQKTVRLVTHSERLLSGKHLGTQPDTSPAGPFCK